MLSKFSSALELGVRCLWFGASDAVRSCLRGLELGLCSDGGAIACRCHHVHSFCSANLDLCKVEVLKFHTRPVESMLVVGKYCQPFNSLHREEMHHFYLRQVVPNGFGVTIIVGRSTIKPHKVNNFS